MNDHPSTSNPPAQPNQIPSPSTESLPGSPVCQLCGGKLIEIRAKLLCERCHTIWETCCEGGRG
jgi:transposase